MIRAGCALLLGFFVLDAAWAQSPANLSLGVYIYPKQNQSRVQQDTHERECYGWAKQQTGTDPSAPAPPPASPEKVKGGGAKGAAGGAGRGAVLGAITGDAGQGAAAGAALGTMRGRRQQRKANQQAEKQAAASGKQQQEEKMAAFRKGYAACLEGRGYSVK